MSSTRGISFNNSSRWLVSSLITLSAWRLRTMYKFDLMSVAARSGCIWIWESCLVTWYPNALGGRVRRAVRIWRLLVSLLLKASWSPYQTTELVKSNFCLFQLVWARTHFAPMAIRRAVQFKPLFAHFLVAILLPLFHLNLLCWYTVIVRRCSPVITFCYGPSKFPSSRRS